MSPVEQREEAMRMLLAEIRPSVTFRITPNKSGPIGVTPYSISWGGGDAEGSRAAMLTVLRFDGPNAIVRCPGHQRYGRHCDGVPVSWALLGHTCGRSDGAT